MLQKMAGAMAAKGASMSKILAELEAAGKGLGTIGVCCYPCSPPGQNVLYNLPRDQLEIGTGIHGEVGVARMQVGAPVYRSLLTKCPKDLL